MARPTVEPRVKQRHRVGLVCAGGGITGAVYEMGCLRALEDILDRSVLDMDLYVGVSGGAFVASLLANGVSPRDMYDEVATRAGQPLGVPAATLFRLGLSEFLRRSTQAPRVLSKAVKALTVEGASIADLALSVFELLPAGLLENSGVQEFLAEVFRMRGRTDSFADLMRELYIVAVDLDSAEAVAFGEPGHMDIPISRAVQASTALPGLYRPVRIGGRDYVDGGVKKTAHINLAIQRHADLVICLNPIVPINNDVLGAPAGHLSNRGMSYVLDQVLRIMLHGRMQYGLERYQTEHPEVDILVLEPARDDLRMFSYNIMRYSARRVVAQHGYRSLMLAFKRNAKEYGAKLGRHGIGFRDPTGFPDLPTTHPFRSRLARNLASSLDLLNSRLGGMR